jgi:hypothetical protein
MAKQVLMEMEEYNKELETSFSNGFTQSRTQMITVVSKILKGMGDQVTLAENAEPELKAFVEMLRKAADALPEGTLDEQADGETDQGDQKLSDDESHKDNV